MNKDNTATLPSFDQVMTAWFFRQNITATALTFAFEQTPLDYIVVRFTVGEKRGEDLFLWQHMGDIPEDQIEMVGELATIDLKLFAKDSLPMLERVIEEYQTAGFFHDYFGNQHFLMNVLFAGYYPDANNKKAPITIPLGSGEDHIFTNEGPFQLHDALQEYALRNA